MTPARLATFVLVAALTASMTFGVVSATGGAPQRRPSAHAQWPAASDSLRWLDWRRFDVRRVNWNHVDWSRIAHDIIHLPQTVRTALNDTLSDAVSRAMGDANGDDAPAVRLIQPCRDRV